MTKRKFWLGMQVGGKAGFLISSAYAAPLVLPFLIMPFLGSLALGIALAVGVIPSMLIGLTTGAIIGCLISRLEPYLTHRRAVLAGVGVSVVVAVALNLTWQLSSKPSAQWIYWLILAIPSMIYSVTGGWIGKEIFRQSQEASYQDPLQSNLVLILIELVVVAIVNIAIALNTPPSGSSVVALIVPIISIGTILFTVLGIRMRSK